MPFSQDNVKKKKESIILTNIVPSDLDSTHAFSKTVYVINIYLKDT